MSTRVLKRVALALLIVGGGSLFVVVLVIVLPAPDPAWYRAGERPSELDWDRASESIRDAYAADWAVERKWRGITRRYPSQEYRVINPDKPAVEIGPPGANSAGKFDEVVPVPDWVERVEALEQCVSDRVAADNWKRRDDNLYGADRVENSFFLCWRNISHEQVCNEDGYLVDEVWRRTANLNPRRDVIPRCLRRDRILRIVDPPAVGCATAEKLDRLIQGHATLQEMVATGACRPIIEDTVRYSVYDVRMSSGGERLVPATLNLRNDDMSTAWIRVDDWEDITGDPKVLTRAAAEALALQELQARRR